MPNTKLLLGVAAQSLLLAGVVVGQRSQPSTGARPLFGDLVLNNANADVVLPLPFESREFDAPYVPPPLQRQAGNVNLSSTPHFQVQNQRLAQGVLGKAPTIVEAISIPTNYFWAYEAPVYFEDTDTAYFSTSLLPQGNASAEKSNVYLSIPNVKQVAEKARRAVKAATDEEARALKPSYDADVKPVGINSTALQMINGGSSYGNDHILLVSSGRTEAYPPSVALVSRKDPTNVTTLLNNAAGKQFNGFDDVTVHPTSGQIFFTDSLYGSRLGFRPYNFTLPLSTWLFDPVSKSLKVVDTTAQVPNGVVISPDGKTAYISDAAPIQSLTEVDAGKPSQINAFDVVTHDLGGGEVTHTLENQRAFAWASAGIVDGLKVDAEGNVYGAMADGVQVWNKAGIELFKIFLPGGTTVNLAFAGDGNLFITGQTRVWLVEGLEAKAPKPARIKLV